MPRGITRAFERAAKWLSRHIELGGIPSWLALLQVILGREDPPVLWGVRVTTTDSCGLFGCVSKSFYDIELISFLFVLVSIGLLCSFIISVVATHGYDSRAEVIKDGPLRLFQELEKEEEMPRGSSMSMFSRTTPSSGTASSNEPSLPTRGMASSVATSARAPTAPTPDTQRRCGEERVFDVQAEGDRQRYAHVLWRAEHESRSQGALVVKSR